MAIDIANIKARLANATPGPWKWREHDTDEYTCLDSDKSLVICLKDVYAECGETLIMEIEKADADFIAHAPGDIRDLLAELERKENALAEAVAFMTEYKDRITATGKRLGDAKAVYVIATDGVPMCDVDYRRLASDMERIVYSARLYLDGEDGLNRRELRT